MLMSEHTLYAGIENAPDVWQMSCSLGRNSSRQRKWNMAATEMLNGNPFSILLPCCLFVQCVYANVCSCAPDNINQRTFFIFVYSLHFTLPRPNAASASGAPLRLLVCLFWNLLHIHIADCEPFYLFQGSCKCRRCCTTHSTPRYVLK